MNMETDGRIKMAFSATITSLICTILSIFPFVPRHVFWTCLFMFGLSGSIFAFLTYKLGQEDREWKKKLEKLNEIDN